MSEITIQLKNMFGLNALTFTNMATNYYLKSYFVLIIIAAVASTPLFKNIVKQKHWKWVTNLEPIYNIVLLLVCTAFLIDASFNPFLYFRF